MNGEYLKKPYSALSTGRKRRLHLALSLCHNPQILILDEPTAGLDVEGRHALHKEINRLKTEGVSILIATHDMSEAEALCDNIAILQTTPLLVLIVISVFAFGGSMVMFHRINMKT